MYFMALLAYLHSVTKRGLPGRLAWSRPFSAHAMAVATPIAAVVILLGAWVLNAPAVARATTLVQAVTPTEIQVTSGVAQQIQKPPADVLTEFQASWDPGVWPGNPIGKQEVMEQLLQYGSTNASSITDPQTQTDFFDTSLSYGQAILGERSTDARINLFLGSFLASWGQTAQARSVSLQNALKESPGKQQILFEIGQNRSASERSYRCAVDVQVPPPTPRNAAATATPRSTTRWVSTKPAILRRGINW